MTSPPAAPPTVIDADLACAICGYNLKGLSPDGNCPECGQAVARTFTPELERSDPKWLRHQANTMLLLAVLCVVNHTPTLPFMRGSAGWFFMTTVAAVVSAWACWRLAAPEPPGPPGTGEASAQRALRFASCGYAAVLVGAVTAYLADLPTWRFAGIAAFATLIGTDALAAWFVLRLARRSADRSPTLHARVVLWALPLSHAWRLFLSTGAWALLGEGPIVTWADAVLTAISYLAVTSVFVAALLFGRMHEALRAAARRAETGRGAPPAVAATSSEPS